MGQCFSSSGRHVLRLVVLCEKSTFAPSVLQLKLFTSLQAAIEPLVAHHALLLQSFSLPRGSLQYCGLLQCIASGILSSTSFFSVCAPAAFADVPLFVTVPQLLVLSLPHLRQLLSGKRIIADCVLLSMVYRLRRRALVCFGVIETASLDSCSHAEPGEGYPGDTCLQVLGQ